MSNSENTRTYATDTSGEFAKEFEAYMSAMSADIQPGKIVAGKIISVDKDYVTVDISFKSDGLVPTSQFKDIKGKVKAEVGQTVDVMILALENNDNQVVLSFERAMQKTVWEKVERLFEEGGTVEGTIIQKVKGGLHVDIGIPAFLPGSQVDIRPHRNLDKFLGETYEFKILKITKEKGNIVLSRLSLIHI